MMESFQIYEGILVLPMKNTDLQLLLGLVFSNILRILKFTHTKANRYTPAANQLLKDLEPEVITSHPATAGLVLDTHKSGRYNVVNDGEFNQLLMSLSPSVET